MERKNSEIHRIIEEVGTCTDMYLAAETSIKTSEISYQFSGVQKLQLSHLTSIIAVGGHLKVMFAFSFDQTLAEQLMRDYTAELNLDEDELELVTGETVAEMINIILGNVLADFMYDHEAIPLTPPIVIYDAKNIYRDKNALFVSGELKTSFGNMQIHCIGPKELFDQELNYVEAIS